MNEQPALTGHDQQMEEFLGKLLRIGVSIAAAVVAAAGVWYLTRHGAEIANYHTFRGISPPSRAEILAGVLQGHSHNLIQVGLGLLVATPVARVVMSLILFARERDWTYVGITAVVLCVLLLSLSGI